MLRGSGGGGGGGGGQISNCLSRCNFIYTVLCDALVGYFASHTRKEGESLM